VESSFGQYQNLKRIRGLEKEVDGLETALEDARAYEAPCGDFSRVQRYRKRRAELDALRAAQGPGGRRSIRSVEQAEPGRLALVRRRTGPGLGVICRVDPRRHRTVVTLVLPHGEVVSLKATHVKRMFWSTPPLHVPRDWERRPAALAVELRRLSMAELQAREREQGREGSLAEIECHRCPWGALPRCESAAKGLERLESRHAQRVEMLESLRNTYWQEFLRVVEVLERFGAAEDGKLLTKGQLIAGLRHDNELLVAEAVLRGLFDDLAHAEAAALCSCLVEESRSGDGAVARLFLRKRPKLARKMRQLEEVAETVLDEQRARHLSMPVSVSTGFMPSVFRWASGDNDWASIVEESFGGHEGDLIRAFRRLIDLLRQLGESPELPPALAASLDRGARVIDRGIVLESALI